MTDNIPLIQVLGAIAYGELKAYDGAKAEAEGRAKSAIAEAQGQAESAKIVSAAIAGNPNYMKLKELENRKDVADILAKSQNVIYLPSNSLVNIGGLPNSK